MRWVPRLSPHSTNPTACSSSSEKMFVLDRRKQGDQDWSPCLLFRLRRYTLNPAIQRSGMYPDEQP